MAVKTRKRKFSLDEVVVCVESHVTADGEVVHQGDRLRGEASSAAELYSSSTARRPRRSVRHALRWQASPPSPPTISRIVLPAQLTAASPHALVVTAEAHFTLEDGSLCGCTQVRLSTTARRGS
jgi:hypothetical protein